MAGASSLGCSRGVPQDIQDFREELERSTSSTSRMLERSTTNRRVTQTKEIEGPQEKEKEDDEKVEDERQEEGEQVLEEEVEVEAP